MNTVYLSLGSNAGDRHNHLQSAIRLLRQGGLHIASISPVYETSPWGFYAAVPFLNLAVEVSTLLSPMEVFLVTSSVESALGRDRHHDCGDGQAYSSRTMDIDILFYNNELHISESLTIPHPRMHERKFVLEPMAFLAPDLLHPLLGMSVSALNQRCPDTGSVTLWLPEAMAAAGSDHTGTINV